MKKQLIHFPLIKVLRAGFRFQVSGFKNPYKSFKSLIHSTPLALWRGVGGEAFSFFILHSSFFIFTLLLTSCFRTETNGEFGGNWQMTEWKQLSNDSLIATNNDVQLHYTIHRDLIKFQNYTQSYEYYLATFHLTTDSLCIDNIYHSPIDTLVLFDELSLMGIDSTGRFLIEHLTSEKMVLKNAAYQLKFRKY